MALFDLLRVWRGSVFNYVHKGANSTEGSRVLGRLVSKVGSFLYLTNGEITEEIRYGISAGANGVLAPVSAHVPPYKVTFKHVP